MNQQLSDSLMKKINRKYSTVKMNRPLAYLLSEAVEEKGLDKFYVVNEAIVMWLKANGYGNLIDFHIPVNRTFKDEMEYCKYPFGEKPNIK
ncbi:hypothetical protein [Desulfogranum japonicum]|uniref:hypothetical protein n=1 Tax=Desulfogranum japonicum TaxID=231447 RepID=UPI00040FE2D5|nr:hypothetical protein [Desulfogranum japonicum]